MRVEIKKGATVFLARGYSSRTSYILPARLCQNSCRFPKMINHCSEYKRRRQLTITRDRESWDVMNLFSEDQATTDNKNYESIFKSNCEEWSPSQILTAAFSTLDMCAVNNIMMFMSSISWLTNESDKSRLHFALFRTVWGRLKYN